MSKLFRGALIGFLLSVTLALPALADTGAVTAKPANPDPNNSRTRSWFIYQADPGKVINDSVEVINSSIEPKKIAVYATDSITASQGAFSCKQKVEPATEAGGWIQLSKSTVVLDAGATQNGPFSITVPDSA